jgi:hypothetical protein
MWLAPPPPATPDIIPTHLVPLTQCGCLPCNGCSIQTEPWQQHPHVLQRHFQLTPLGQELQEGLRRTADVQCKGPAALGIRSQEV